MGYIYIYIIYLPLFIKARESLKAGVEIEGLFQSRSQSFILGE